MEKNDDVVSLAPSPGNQWPILRILGRILPNLLQLLVLGGPAQPPKNDVNTEKIIVEKGSKMSR